MACLDQDLYRVYLEDVRLSFLVYFRLQHEFDDEARTIMPIIGKNLKTPERNKNELFQSELEFPVQVPVRSNKKGKRAFCIRIFLQRLNSYLIQM
jgi:hypothetical protein